MVYFFHIIFGYPIREELIDLSRSINQSLNTAFASAQMEGFQITPKIEADCKMIVNGELSISEYIRRVTEAKGHNDRRAGHVVQP